MNQWLNLSSAQSQEVDEAINMFVRAQEQNSGGSGSTGQYTVVGFQAFKARRFRRAAMRASSSFGRRSVR